MKKITFFFACAVLGLSAQNNVRKLSLPECIGSALANNEHIKTAGYDLAYQKQFKKASTEVPKTGVVFTQGQFNSKYKYDNSVAVTQQIPFPAVFSAHNSLAKAYIKGSEYKLAATKAELIYQVSTTYYSLLYHYARHQLLLREDSIYETFARTGQVKYEQGAGSLLEKTTSETKVMEIKNMLLENEADIHADKINLQTLINSEKQEDIVFEYLTDKPLSVNLDTSDISTHPYLRYLKQQIVAGQKNKMLEIAKIFPDLQFGYFNLSIYGPADIGTGPYFQTTATRMQGFTLGVTIPLWLHPLAAKVKAAEIKKQMAQADYNYNKDLFDGQYDEAYTLYLKYHNSINYYKQSALTNSRSIITEASKAYETKEIGYVDYLSVISNALNIESNYLNVIHQNNLAALKIQYLSTE